MPEDLGVTGSADSDLLAPEVFDSRAVPQHLFLELYNREYSSDSLVAVPAPSAGKSLDLMMTRWTLENTAFAHTDNFDQLGRVLDDRADQSIFITRYLRGSTRSWFDGREYLTRKGDIAIAMSARGTIFETKDLVTFAVILPVDLLGIDRGLVSAPKMIPAGSLENRILSGAIELWQNELQGLRRADAGLLEASVLGLIRSVLLYGADAVQRNVDAAQARGHAIRRFLEAEWARPDLGVELISRTFNISRATIYRSFEEDGGIAGFVTRHRLQSALGKLASGPPHRGRIQEVASTVGFTDASQFSKAFRRHFGFSPSDVLPLAEISGYSD